MLDELRQNIAADIGLFREEISGVLTCLQNTEIKAAAHETRLTKVEWQLTTLQTAQAQTRESMASQEDSLPDTIESAEIPHLFCRLFGTLFTAKQAKFTQLDGWYRLIGPNTLTPGKERDIIKRFQLGQDRMAFMVATRNKSPLYFEGHDLTFYPELSRETMAQIAMTPDQGTTTYPTGGEMLHPRQCHELSLALQ
ncbi:Hypothetical predicted protein [Pelobates cultripes]|uniref:Uncharacterized protein n=1 Tax=Pelobates cultripes TaxID=61616 RepID=A0AAD1W8Z0_PELCU|nr:Hypothetical predicted protein [Pelobates cultripes]